MYRLKPGNIRIMTMNIKGALKSLLLFFLLGISAISTGYAASPVLLQDMDGEYHSLHEYTGQGDWLIVAIWASDCHICNSEIGQITGFHRDNKNQGASILGVTLDGYGNKENARSFIDRHDVNFPNLIGDISAISSFYRGATGEFWVGTPTFLVYAPDGELMGRQVGGISQEIMETFISRAKLQIQVRDNTDTSNPG